MSTCAELQHKLQTLQTELLHVTDDQAQQKIYDEIDVVSAQMQAQGCLGPSERISTLTGQVTLRTDDSNEQGRGPFQLNNIAITLAFPANQSSFYVKSLFSINVPNSDATIDITKDDNGRYSSSDMAIDITLHIDPHSALAGSSDGTFGMTTGQASSSGPFQPTGVPIDGAGNVTLVGTTQFTGGHWDGNHGQLMVAGQLSPWPPS